MSEIRNSLPEYCSAGYEQLFISKQEYAPYTSKVAVRYNVFISHWGLMIKNGFMPLRTAENLIGYYDKAFYFPHYRKALEQYLVCRFGKSLPFVNYNEETPYFTIHTPWFGYFSWFTSNLPRLINVHQNYPDAILLLPEKIGELKFVTECLRMFPDLKIREVKDSHHMFIKNYVFAQVKPWTSQFLLSELEMVRKLCFGFIENNFISKHTDDRIYISRRKAHRRSITNELEVETYLQSQGFVSVCYEDLNVFDQIALTKNAKIIVSLHGAGLTNTMFMQEGSTVLELTPSWSCPVETFITA